MLNHFAKLYYLANHYVSPDWFGLQLIKPYIEFLDSFLDVSNY